MLKIIEELLVENIINGHSKRCQEPFCIPAAIFLLLERWIYIYTNIHNLDQYKGLSVK